MRQSMARQNRLFVTRSSLWGFDMSSFWGAMLMCIVALPAYGQLPQEPRVADAIGRQLRVEYGNKRIAIDTSSKRRFGARSAEIDSILVRSAHAVARGDRDRFVSCPKGIGPCELHGADVVAGVGPLWLRGDSASVTISSIAPPRTSRGRTRQVRQRWLFVNNGAEWVLVRRERFAGT